MPTINGNLTNTERRQVENWLDNKVICACGQRMELHPKSPIFDRRSYAEPNLPMRSIIVVCNSCARGDAMDPDVMGIFLSHPGVCRPLPSAKPRPNSNVVPTVGEANRGGGR